MKVKATQPGFYGCYRVPGDVFEIKGLIKGNKDKGIEDSNDFSHNWMETVKATDKKPDPKPEPKVIKDDFSEMDDDKLIAYAKANCPGLTLTKTMKDSTMRERIRAYKPM